MLNLLLAPRKDSVNDAMFTGGKQAVVTSSSALVSTKIQYNLFPYG